MNSKKSKPQPTWSMPMTSIICAACSGKALNRLVLGIVVNEQVERIQTHDAVDIANRAQLIVGQIARCAAKRAAVEWDATKGFCVILTRSQKPLSFRWETSSSMPFSCMRRTASLPTSVRP